MVCQPVGDWLRQAAATIIGGYRVQIVAGFNKVCFLLELAAGIYCFSAAQVPGPVVAVLAPVLLILRFRSAYTFPGKIKSRKGPAPSRWQGSLDSLGDAASGGLMVLLFQSLMLNISQSLTLPSTMTLRGTVLLVPILGCVRMAFRPRFHLKMPFHGSNLTADQIYRRTWWLTSLWVAAFVGTIIANPDSLPDWVPEHDFLRTFIPMHIFIYWFRFQQNPFIRRDHIETIFEDFEKKKKARKRERLIKGLKKGEPFYRTYVALQGVLFLYLSIPLLTNLWPWLSGHQTSLDWFRISFNVVTLVILAWTWNDVKDANRAAAGAMQQDIDAMEWGRPVKPRLKWWRYLINGLKRRLLEVVKF
jgi:hypothetical protein